MNRTIHALLALSVATLILMLSSPVLAAGDLFPLKQVRIGLRGTGKTVIRGTKIETFDFEVIDVIPEGGFDGGPMILARFSGPVIDFSNGIAAGYSGSPVYINDKLLGAVSTAIPYTDTHIGGITPIGSMLSALPSRYVVDYEGNTVIPEPRVQRRLRFMGSLREAEEFNEEHAEDGELAGVRLSAPLIVSGASPRLVAELREKFSDNPFVDVVPGAMVGGQRPAGLLYDPASERPLQPGDAVAISLVSGDIDLSAIGTLTYVDDRGQLLAFGHPFLLGGETSMPIGKAYITYTYKSDQRAFKSGYRINVVGAVTQDRMSAVGGLIGELPDTIPLRVKVNDIDYNRQQEFNVDVIRDPDFFDFLASTVVSEAFTRVADAVQGGTIRLEFSMNGVGLKEPITRTNYYYDTTMPVGLFWDEALPLASLLANNIYREVKLTEFEVKIDYTRNRVNASIDSAELYLPGEKVKAEPKESGEPAQGESEATSQGDSDSSNGDGGGVEETSPAEGGEDAGYEPPRAASETMTVNLQPAQDIIMPPPTMPQSPPQQPSGEAPKNVHPGDTFRIVVRLQPYREEHVQKTLYVTLPDDFPTGPSSVIVHGGGSLVSILNEFGGRGRMLMGSGDFLRVDAEIHDLDQIIEKALETPLNNEVVVSVPRPMQPPVPSAYGQKPPASSAEGDEAGEKDEKPEQEFRVSLATEWVIYNQQVIPINVLPKAKDAKSAAKQQGASARGSSPAENEEAQ